MDRVSPVRPRLPPRTRLWTPFRFGLVPPNISRSISTLGGRNLPRRRVQRVLAVHACPRNRHRGTFFLFPMRSTVVVLTHNTDRLRLGLWWRPTCGGPLV